ncbi:glycosyl hydrolase [Microbacterium sp. CGR1]|uniref:glycosyl hydrolase n=1 Tax=Microbacterium sp. CGR1 TaxID=1696072 RepID=UPI00069CDBA9|nr:glycosyl hydrolase [Microbacterium sp. CGR1]
MMALRATKKTIIIASAVTVLLVGGGAAAAMVISGQQAQPRADASPEASPEPVVTESPAVVPVTNVARASVDGWTLADRRVVGTVLPEVGDAAQGAVSLRVDAPADDADIVAATAPVALAPDTEYTLTASVRVLAGEKTETGVRLTAGGQTFTLPELDAEWETIEFPFTSTADQPAASTLDVVLSGAVRGFGIDDVSITAAGTDNLVPNGSFEAVQTPAGIVNDSLVMTDESAVLAVSLAEGPVQWSATSTAGGEPITGEFGSAGPLSALPLTGVTQGHYTVAVNDSSGRKIQTDVAVIDTDGFSVSQDGRFGVGAHVEKEAFIGTGSLAAAIGFAEVRNDISWERNEKVAGQYVWDENYVREFERMHANDVKLLGLVVYGNRLYGARKAPGNEAAIQAYGAYAKAVADRFDLVGLEVLNEFNHRENDTACGPAPACYVPIAQAVRDHVSTAYPDLPIVTGSTALYDSEWFTGFWQAGGMAVTDAASYHPYESWINRDADLIAGTVQQSYADMQEFAGETRPVWVTEMGFPTHYDGVSVLEQGQMMVRNQALAFANGVEKYFWYDLVNDAADPAAGESNFGLYENSPRPDVVALAPKPGAFAQALMITQLRDKAFASDESDDTTTVEVFGTEGDETRIAWAKQGEVQHTFASDVPVTVTDMSGQTQSIVPEGGEVTLTLGASPIFISSEAE